MALLNVTRWWWKRNTSHRVELSTMARDLVCKMEATEDSRFFSEYGNDTFYFCSADCKRKFDDHPDMFIREDAGERL
jgi:YHS domain-containing protein